MTPYPTVENTVGNTALVQLQRLPGALVAALRVAQTARNATIAFIVCDRGDRYLSTGLFDEQV